MNTCQEQIKKFHLQYLLLPVFSPDLQIDKVTCGRYSQQKIDSIISNNIITSSKSKSDRLSVTSYIPLVVLEHDAATTVFKCVNDVFKVMWIFCVPKPAVFVFFCNTQQNKMLVLFNHIITVSIIWSMTKYKIGVIWLSLNNSSLLATFFFF